MPAIRDDFSPPHPQHVRTDQVEHRPLERSVVRGLVDRCGEAVVFQQRVGLPEEIIRAIIKSKGDAARRQGSAMEALQSISQREHRKLSFLERLEAPFERLRTDVKGWSPLMFIFE